MGSTRWVWRGTALGALLLGWIFIAWQNHFHVTAPLVFVCLAYLAVVATVYNLFRTGAAAVASGDDDGDSTWAKQTGALGELEREKRTLLKAIKEAEFDHQMGKLSKHDVDEMIRVYRARAIEVIKEIDQLGTGSGGTTREQIMREVRARIELDAKAHKRAEPAKAAAESAAADKRKGKDKDKDKKRGKGAAKADEAASRAANSAASAESADSAESAAAANRAAEAHAEASDERADGAANHAEPAAARTSDAASAAERTALHDEAMDADSTTAVESTREHRAKEATP